MAVIFDEMFEIVFRREADFHIPLDPQVTIFGAVCHRKSLDKSLIAQYFRTIADVDGLVNSGVYGVVGQFEIMTACFWRCRLI